MISRYLILAKLVWQSLVPFLLIIFYGERITMRHLLRYLSKKDMVRKVKPLAFMVGALYGNLELYGYFGTAAIAVDFVKTNLRS
jgi:lipid-A-disaccharide synthase-like uncharacterized protein